MAAFTLPKNVEEPDTLRLSEWIDRWKRTAKPLLTSESLRKEVHGLKKHVAFGTGVLDR